ncbi:MAG: hypothetical protein JO246_05210 [Frankiaceae bacterium]|nr:hypothetical protein [Frankiaceae bacterium]MBV9872360.1 hypothetical protein [Frankiaceae bacterium]
MAMPDLPQVLTLDACRRRGMTDRRVRWFLESQRWQQVFPRVYATFNGPIPLAVKQSAAVLYAGEGAVLSHSSSGRCWRLCPPPGKIDVTVPYPRDAADQPGIIIHRSKTLCADDVHPVFSPPRLTVEATVLDLLPRCSTADAALCLIADALRWPLTTPASIRHALLAKPCTRWRKVVLEALPDLAAGAQSSMEVREMRLRRAHGVPVGRRQFTRLADGTEHLDDFDAEFRVHTELDGRLGHDRGRDVFRDMRRDNRSELEQVRHLRYGWADLFDRPCEVAIQEALIYRQQGWTGKFKRCRKCPPLPSGL